MLAMLFTGLAVPPAVAEEPAPAAEQQAEPAAPQAEPVAAAAETNEGPAEEPAAAASTPEETGAAEPAAPEETGAVEPVEPAGDVSTLSTTPGSTYIRQDNTFYAYVGSGENLDVHISKYASLAGATAVTVSVRGPGGVSRTCTKQTSDAANTACTWPDLTSSVAGVWAVTFDVSGTTSDYYKWQINVQRNTTTLPGRVYSERYRMFQGATYAARTNFDLWYQNELGYLYEAKYSGFNGVDSIIFADSTGVRYNGTCTSAYASVETADANRSPSSLNECGDPYKIFFEAPSADLPARATLWNGTTDWIKPAVAPLPTITGLSYSPDSALSRRGDIDFTVENFTGQLVVEVDTDSDGSYDVTIPGSAVNGAGSVRFDGLDGDGKAVPSTRNMAIRASIAQMGEIHFTNVDVEIREGGLQVTRLNGPGAGDRRLHWNDTGLSTTTNCGTRPNPLDARAGVNSTGGAHAWTTAGCSTVNGWGNGRYIDDWSSVPVNVSRQIAVSGTLFDFGDAPDSFGTFVAANGPRHALTKGLRIGAEIDAEADGQPGAAAAGDDSSDTADEDAFSTPVVLNPGVTSAELTVPVTNTTNNEATLYGWIDANNNGVFEPSEFASTPVPAGSTRAELSFVGLTPARDGTKPMLRLRMTTDDLADDAGTHNDERALGAVSNGEVEDHQAQVATVVPLSCVAPFVETFGAGAGYGPPLAAGQTTYLYEGSAAVNDGEYGLVSTLPGAAGGWWHPGSDHTPGDADGRMMLINASYDAGIFFQRTFTQLVPGANYDFSAWITNANNANSGIVPNLAFRVIDPATGDVLARGSTGDISNKASLVWERHGLQFKAAQSTVRLELVNNAPGGGGNDLAVDDISFAPVCEFGDAPDSYGTTIAADGAGHVASGPTLGVERDTEPDGQPNEAADSDDSTGTPDDEDGVTGPLTMTVHEASRLAVSATNDSTVPVTLAGWLDLDGDGAFQDSERALVTVPASTGTKEYALDFPAGSVTADTFARFRIYNQLVADPRPSGTARGGEVEDYRVTMLTPALSVVKTSTASANTRPGDTVRYTVTATNRGTGAFTDANPAVVLDDLSDVLDDATFDGQADASVGAEPVYDSPLLSWSGALESGESVNITYSVVLANTGDGKVRNVAFVPDCDPADEGCNPQTPACDPPTDPGTDAATGVPCAVTEFLMPALSHVKVADTTELPADGGVVGYTITVTNEGPGVFTEDAPATVSDDLSQVLDDAVFNGQPGATIGTASYDAATGRLSWAGALNPGETATITYSVTYDDSTGDNVLLNVACLPVILAADPADPCRSVQIPGSELQERKSVNPASGTSVASGQDVTYTLYFENTGRAEAVIDTYDDLADVLDDARLTGGPVSSDPAVTATPNGDRLDIAGTVPAGATLTVTYTVTVNAFSNQENHVLANVLGGSEGCLSFDPTCRTESPVRHLNVAKTSDPAAGVNTGDTVSYTLTIHNDGTGDYTAETPAAVQDSLAAVLDDATFDGTATATAGSVSYTAPVLNWTGALAAGVSVSVRYEVTVTNTGDHTLENVAGASCASPELCEPPVTVLTPLPHVVPAKTSDPGTGTAVKAGQVISYTLTYTNDGKAPGTVDSTDDLSDVLDDGMVTTEPAASNTAVSADRNGNRLRVTGTIPAGGTITVTYQVTIGADGERGNNIAANVLTADVPPYQCPDGATGCEPFVPPATTHPISELQDWKTVDPASGSTVRPGQELSYTLHFRNTGKADVTVDRDDVISQLLDDAAITAAPASSDPALIASPVVAARFTVAGVLRPGQTVTVSYMVKVNPDGQRGDDRLGNYLLPRGAEPTGECLPGDPDQADCTVNHVSTLAATKSVNPATGTTVEQGQDLVYTLTFTNTSTNTDAAAAAVDYTDHLAGVLDDAELTNGPSETGGLTVTGSSGKAMHITGELASGKTATITYTVKVKDHTRQNDHQLLNFLAPTGEEAGEACTAGTTLCTHNPINPPTPDVPTPPAEASAADGPRPAAGTLAETGAAGIPSLLALAVLALLGGVLLLGARRRRRNEAPGNEA